MAFDETTSIEDVDKLFKVFSSGKPVSIIILLSTIIFPKRLPKLSLWSFKFSGELHCSIYCVGSSESYSK